MKKLASIGFFIAVLIALADLPSWGAVVISVNFQGGNTVGLAPGDLTGEIAVGNWNNALSDPGPLSSYSGPPLGLVDSAGAVSPVQLTAYANGLDGPEGPLTDNSSPQSILFGGGLNAHFGGGTFTVTGLSAFISYDVLVYYYCGQSFPDTRTGEFTASGSALTYYAAGFNNALTSYLQSNSTVLGTYATGNYVSFSNLTADSETITLGNTNNRETLVGFQIIGTTAVPEPSSLALAGLGAVGLALSRRRRASI